MRQQVTVLCVLLLGFVLSIEPYQPFLCEYPEEGRSLEVLRNAWVEATNSSDFSVYDPTLNVTVVVSLCGLNVEQPCNGVSNTTACRYYGDGALETVGEVSNGIFWQPDSNGYTAFPEFTWEVRGDTFGYCTGLGPQTGVQFICDPSATGLGTFSLTFATECQALIRWDTALACELPPAVTTTTTTTGGGGGDGSGGPTSSGGDGGDGGDGGGDNAGIIAGASGGGGGLVLVIVLAGCLLVPCVTCCFLLMLLCVVAVIAVIAIVVVVLVVGAATGGSAAVIKRSKGDRSEPVEPWERTEIGLLSRSGTLMTSTGEMVKFRMLEASECRVLREIGRGAFGKVYEGEWQETTRVAIKEIDISNVESVEEVEREVAVMAKLGNHPHVVNFIGSFVSHSEEKLFIVTAFYENGSLHDVLFINGARPPGSHLLPRQLLGMMRDAAAGIMFLHRSDIIHRDIAARNCLVDGRLNVAVSDFGTSRFLEQEETGGATTTLMGPVRWMAPECFATDGRSDFSPASDVWSFGVMLYEVFSRKLPYDGMDLVTIASRVRDGRLRPEVPDGAPEVIGRIMAGCFEFAPGARLKMKDIFDLLREEVGESAAASSRSDSNWAVPDNPGAVVYSDTSHVQAEAQGSSAAQCYVNSGRIPDGRAAAPPHHPPPPSGVPPGGLPNASASTNSSAFGIRMSDVSFDDE